MANEIPILVLPPQAEGVSPFIVQGDTIYEMNFTVTGVDLTGADIHMQLYSDVDGNNKVMDASTGASGDDILNSVFTIVDATNFKLDKIPATHNNLPAGILYGDLQITLASVDPQTEGDRVTPFRVNMTVQKQYTRPPHKN